ncbi:hypothetical protein OW763_01265 [Clostridium aestuarii]|uniref:Uncharacterized protein n=1 Tax=Clostridium aestuarii TaxID=338193 RepID=A0ABT4CVH5_9CLOT|nr:hypothetical protein [Clostridium aestuarii]MCY6482984.1 hypothetical protein [Clostridium aestuarii]
MKILKNFYDRLFKNTEENEVSIIDTLEEIKDKLDNDEKYNLAASEAFINMQNMFSI